MSSVLIFFFLPGSLTARASQTPSLPTILGPFCPFSCVRICNSRPRLSPLLDGLHAALLRTLAPSVTLTRMSLTSQFSWAAPAQGCRGRRVTLHTFLQQAHHRKLHRLVWELILQMLQACWAMCALSVSTNRAKITSVQV